MMMYSNVYKRSNKWLLGIVMLIWMTSPLRAQGLDDRINDAFMPIADWWEDLIFTPIIINGVEIPVVLILLLFGALFFTVYFGFINMRLFPTAIKVVRGKYDHLEQLPIQDDLIDTIKDESKAGEVNHFQALTTAISGTVGLGNIAMVAVAISIGGPGSTFWMILAGLLGMSTKFVECTLGVKYRDISEDGSVHGGPMYYLKKGLDRRGLKYLGKGLSICFAVLCVGASLGGGNAFQSNQAAAQIITRFGLSNTMSGTIIGLCFAVVAGIVILGGIKKIARVTEKVIPFMAAFYLISALAVLAINYSLLGEAITLIITEAFTPRATITGGFIGVMIQGFRRAAFSNEAGAGSASIAHAAVKTKFPASEGLVALLEPFIDTVIICTVTALVIVSYNLSDVFDYGDVIDNEVLNTLTGERIGGVDLTSAAFDASIPGFSYLLVIAVVLFAFSTILSWSYYGLQSWKFLFGKGKLADLSFKALFLSFTVLGAAVTLDAVIKFSDAMILALVFPNMIGLLFLFGEAKKELSRYLTYIKED